MLRLLFLCLMLTLQGSADTFTSEQIEGSADVPDDDEDRTREERKIHVGKNMDADKATGKTEDGMTTILIVGAVCAVAVTAAVIIAIVLIRRRMHNRQQGIYTVPAEQGLKGTV